MLIDELMPHYHVTERHKTVIDAPADVVYASLLRFDFGDSPVVRFLFALRGLGALIWGKARPARTPLTLESMQKGGFIPLGENPPHELAFGLAGQFWKAAGGEHAPVRDRDGFLAFNRPGYAMSVMNFSAAPLPDGRTLVRTETRTRCTDDESWRRFRLYWFLIRPFSGLIRLEMLRSLRRYAEASIKCAA